MGLRHITGDDRSNGPHAAPHSLSLRSRANGPYRATVVKVLDGDTVQLEVGLWPGLTQRINLRLVGSQYTGEARS
jgi:endonuclease YncB( thermonuclease family)